MPIELSNDDEIKNDELGKIYLKLEKISKITPQTPEIKNIVNLYIDDTWSLEKKKHFIDYAQDMLFIQFNKNIEDRPSLLCIIENLNKLRNQISR